MAEPKTSSHQKALNLADELKKRAKENKEIIRETGIFSSYLTGHMQSQVDLQKVLNKEGTLRNGITEEILEKTKETSEASSKTGEAIQNLLPGVSSFMQGAEATAMSFKTMLGPIGIAVGIFVAIAKLWLDIAKNIAETRKDLGVSAVEAVKLNVAFKGLAIAGKFIGLEAEDFKESFKSARDNLGATTDEALALSFNLAKISAASGQTAEQLTSVLAVMESVSDASRDALLAQIETNRQLIEQAGVAPADVFRDIAENAEFFAQFAKDGSQNLVHAGIAARKLGLNMNAVAGITESLLDFESSIEGQLTASLLLGRQINLDRARQLALTGDQAGMMKEILRQVGGEAEFNKMNVIQRKALADSVGVNVEQLSRLVRNNTAGATPSVVGAGTSFQEKQLEYLKSIEGSTGKSAGFLGMWKGK